LSGSLGKRRMGGTERTKVAAQPGEALEQSAIGCTCKQKRQQRVFPPARAIDLIYIGRHTGMLIVEISRTGTFAMPVAAFSDPTAR
jgi:hypothetical protein